MLGTKERRFAPLGPLSLEDLVPADHFYRQLDRTLDLSFVRELVAPCYASSGRPSIDPVVFFRLHLVMFFEDIRSERWPRQARRVTTQPRLKQPAHKVQMRQLTRREGRAVRLIPSAQDAQACPLRWREPTQPLCHRLLRDLCHDRAWLIRPWCVVGPPCGDDWILRSPPAGELVRQVASGHRL